MRQYNMEHKTRNIFQWETLIYLNHLKNRQTTTSSAIAELVVVSIPNQNLPKRDLNKSQISLLDFFINS